MTSGVMAIVLVDVFWCIFISCLPWLNYIVFMDFPWILSHNQSYSKLMKFKNVKRECLKYFLKRQNKLDREFDEALQQNKKCYLH